ncbi:MAG: Fis family transcriptional regulator [Rhodocyclaceae bacterium]|nr:MAG: Fis family transcriptional regulator [Rhodocyclaceae bacterium]
MGAASDNETDLIEPDMMEGIANVVAVDGSVAWLEPEQTGSCGSCKSSGACGAKGIGTVASRLEERRFPLTSHPGLKVGDRVVVGVREDALVQASMTVYAVPLLTMFAAGFLAQWGSGSEGMTIVACAAGLGLGFVIAHLRARRLSAHGKMAPRFLRRARIGETCQIE